MLEFAFYTNRKEEEEEETEKEEEKEEEDEDEDEETLSLVAFHHFDLINSRLFYDSSSSFSQ